MDPKYTQWFREGDHPEVMEYPIRGRDYKGFVVSLNGNTCGVRPGDWIVESGDGDIAVVPDEDFIRPIALLREQEDA